MEGEHHGAEVAGNRVGQIEVGLPGSALLEAEPAGGAEVKLCGRSEDHSMLLQRVLLKTAPCCELEAALGTVEAVLRGKVAGEVGQ